MTDSNDVELEIGEVYAKKDGIGSVHNPIRILEVNGFDVKVTDPTESDPRSARYHSWEVNKQGLKWDIARGVLVPATLTVEPRHE